MKKIVIIGGGLLGTEMNRGVVVAVDADDFGAIGLHGLLAALADFGVDIDAAAAAGLLRAA